ncbi:MAG: glycosyltransferase family 2 protein [Rhodobacteraceae bacterium]|nr:glycosyltransferase family 2 protein [Paracoccaceae bacterium]
MPKYSIVVPTRNRIETLKICLESIFVQPERDMEIVVADNASADGTESYVKSLTDSRVVYTRSDEPLSMRGNWTRALQRISGDWLIFIGDDDALMPDFTALAELVMRKADVPIIAWNRPIYRWPSFAGEHERNRLKFRVGTTLKLVDSKAALKAMYQKFIKPFDMPSVYHNLVQRSLVQKITEALNGYPMSISPDMGSGILNLAYSDRFAQFDRPLSVMGYSDGSAGSAFKYTAPDSQQRNAFTSLEPEIDELIQRYPLQGLQSVEAMVFRILKDMIRFVRQAGIEIDCDLHGFADWHVRRIGFAHPDERADVVAKLHALCTENGFSDIVIPSEITNEPVGFGQQMPFIVADKAGTGGFQGQIDFSHTPVADVLGAARVLKGMLPDLK